MRKSESEKWQRVAASETDKEVYAMANGQKKHIALSWRIAFIILLVGGFLLTGAFLMRYNEIAQETSELEEELRLLEEENERLREEISAPWNEEYIKRVARRELGYCLPGEIIYFSNFED